jgi:hypothetical protein
VGKALSLRVDLPAVQEAYLCDVHERDLRPLEIRDAKVHQTMPGTIASVRLLP